MKSLKALQNPLADARRQLEIIGQPQNGGGPQALFQEKLETAGLYPLRPVKTGILQINLGKMCNQVCKHCHVDAGPDRKEIMTQDVMRQCLNALRSDESLTTVDLTGGAPEMNPFFRAFVEEIAGLHRHIIVRCNLTIILANKKYHDLPLFYKKHGVEVVSSLPFYSRDRTDRQRGEGVFEQSITALQALNAAGYGLEGSGLVLNLVYNPSGAFLPPAQESLEKEYKQALEREFGVRFNRLFAIANMPISRYLHYLLETGNYEAYMQKLVAAYNPAAAANVMCRNTVSVGWDGCLYDCDFNQMLELKVDSKNKHIGQYNADELNRREIVVGQHCYGCTAGAGSSCGGSVA